MRCAHLWQRLAVYQTFFLFLWDPQNVCISQLPCWGKINQVQPKTYCLWWNSPCAMIHGLSPLLPWCRYAGNSEAHGKEWKWKSLSSVRLFVIPWTTAHQAPLSMEFSRQEYWSGLPFPSPGDLLNPGIKPRFPTLQADSLPSEPPGKHTAKMLKWYSVSSQSVNFSKF